MLEPIQLRLAFAQELEYLPLWKSEREKALMLDGVDLRVVLDGLV